MRVISGSARGRKLRETRGLDIRPTSGMVKEAIFNIVQFDVEGRRVLDLFAGTGQLGIEALSRGAKSAAFVDLNPDAIKLIRDNIKLCGFADVSSVSTAEALSYLKRDGSFDLIFVDPPYGSPLAVKTINRIIEFDKINTNGIIICEIRADSPTPPVFEPYYVHREYRYGRVKIIKYGRE